MPRPISLQRLAAVAVVVAVLVAVVGVPLVSGKSSATMTVSGASVETVRYAADDPVAGMRSHLAADHEPAPSGDLATLAGHGGHVCHAIGRAVVVSSNVTYDLLVAGVDPDMALRFMTEPPSSYDDCTRGQKVSESMFATAVPTGAWVLGQTHTAKRVHDYTLGLIVRPGDDPADLLAAASFTITALPAS